MQKVARNTRSCQKVAEQLVESPKLSLGARGNRGREAGARYNRQREERKVAGCSSSMVGGSFGPPASPLACVTCIPYS